MAVMRHYSEPAGMRLCNQLPHVLLTASLYYDPEAPTTVHKTYSPKIEGLVEEISSMTIIEVADLVEALKVCPAPPVDR